MAKNLQSPNPIYSFLLITVLLFSFEVTVHAQLQTFIEEYTNVHQPTYDLNKAITLSSIEGSKPKAEEHIALMKEAGLEEYKLAQAHLLYNLYGKQKAYGYLSKEAGLPDERIAYYKVLLAQYTRNLEEKDVLYQAFEDQFPHSDLQLYLELKFYMDYINDNAWNEDEDIQKDLLAAIDKRLTIEQNKEKLLFLELARLDVAKEDLLDLPEEKQQLALIQLRHKYKSFIYDDYLVDFIWDCELPECIEALKTIKQERQLTPKQEVFEILSNEEDDNNSALNEKRLTELIANETDPLKRETLKAMIFAASDEMEMPSDGFEDLMLGNFGKIKHSASLKQQLSPTLSKEELTQQLEASPLVADQPKAAKSKIKKATTEELFYLLGLSHYVQILVSDLEEDFNVFTAVSPNREDIESWEAMKSFLDRNPLYYNEQNLFGTAGYPQVETNKGLINAVLILNELLVKYPGSLALLKTKNELLAINWELMKGSPENYYLMLFRSVFDLFAANEYEGTDQTVYHYIDRGFNEELEAHNYSETLSEILMPGVKMLLKHQLTELQEEHPLHQNLKELDGLFD